MAPVELPPWRMVIEPLPALPSDAMLQLPLPPRPPLPQGKVPVARKLLPVVMSTVPPVPSVLRASMVSTVTSPGGSRVKES